MNAPGGLGSLWASGSSRGTGNFQEELLQGVEKLHGGTGCQGQSQLPGESLEGC